MRARIVALVVELIRMARVGAAHRSCKSRIGLISPSLDASLTAHKKTLSGSLICRRAPFESLWATPALSPQDLPAFEAGEALIWSAAMIATTRPYRRRDWRSITDAQIFENRQLVIPE